MNFSWGGEPLGARTHGGQDPPHRAGAWADGSTVSGRRPSPCQVQRASVGVDRMEG